MTQVRVVADPVHARRRRKRRVHQHDGGPDVAQPVGDGLGVEGGDECFGKQPGQQPRPRLRIFVEMEAAVCALAEGAFGHHGQHAGAGGGLQHGIARPDRGGLERGVGERQRSRELLEANLLLGALRVRGLQRRDGIQHRQHAARPVRPGAGIRAHGPAVALEELDGGGFGGLVGVLPDPGARSIRPAEGPCHRIAERCGIERAAGLQDRQQGQGRCVQGIARDRAGRGCGRVDGGGRKGRTREGVRRRMGVEHGDLRAGRA